ncbi:hypothetical protein R83H12_01559 [Fibrobacteria bacterium R8-3-H12]
MSKKIILCLLAFCSVSFAADAATILANQKKAAFPDTAEIRMRLINSMPGVPSQAIDIRTISKGKEKGMTELKSPLINMKIIRNGDKISVTDLKTGAVLPSQAAAQTGMMAGMDQDFGKPEDFHAPVKEGNLWKLAPIDPAKPVLLYSDEQKRVVKMRQIVQPGIESETSIRYCGKECAFPGTPAAIDIETQANGQSAAKVSLEFISVQKLNEIPDALFEIR